MDKILNFIAYCVVVAIAFPITIIEFVFKVVTFVTICAIFIAMMFFAPLFKNFSWPKPIDKFIDYVFSMNFSITCKVIDTYKNSLNLD